jgi:hypothetical protein
MKKIAILAALMTIAILALIAVFSPEAASVSGLSLAAIAAFARTCGKNVTGNSSVYFTEKDNVSSVTVTAGEISAVTMESNKSFHQADVDIDTLIRTQEGEGVAGNMKYTHRVEMKFSNLDANMNTFRDALADASACGILAIVTDGNGNSWLVGFNDTDQFSRPLRLVQDSDTTGAEPGEEDAGLTTIALECQSGYLDLPFDDTTKATISGGTAAFITYN